MKSKSFSATSTFWDRGSSAPRITTGGRPTNPSRVTPIGTATSKTLGHALFQMANMANPTQRYSKIKQGAKELYLQFIERLQDVIEKQFVNIDARNQLGLQLARDKANKDCKKIIELLANKNPSLDEIIKCLCQSWI